MGTIVMIMYLTLMAITLTPGMIVGLTPEQARRREGMLKLLPDGSYLVEKPFQLKAGERFGFSGDPESLPKAMAECLEPEKLPEPAVPPGGGGGGGSPPPGTGTGTSTGASQS